MECTCNVSNEQCAEHPDIPPNREPAGYAQVQQVILREAFTLVVDGEEFSGDVTVDLTKIPEGLREWGVNAAKAVLRHSVVVPVQRAPSEKAVGHAAARSLWKRVQEYWAKGNRT